MKVTKYPQSCLVVEKDDGGRVLVDAGNVAMDAFDLADFGTIDAALYTHRHPDHYDPRSVEPLLDAGVAVYGNADVAGLAEGITQVDGGAVVEIAGFEVLPRDLPHVVMVDGAPGPPNTGFVFDGAFFHPGDGIAIDGVRVDGLALPIAGPSISFRDAYLLAESVGARTVIPIHYDVFVGDPHLFADKAGDLASVVVLAPGESTEL